MSTMVAGNWLAVRETDERLYALYARHYSFERFANTPAKINARQNARCLKVSGFGDYMALLTDDCRAGWLWTRAPGGVWQSGAQGVNCVLFRNEGPVRSSDLIREACELAWQRWPGERLFTYVADAKIRSVNPGACFKAAGWRRCGRNADGRLTILELLPDASLGTLNRTALSRAG